MSSIASKKALRHSAVNNGSCARRGTNLWRRLSSRENHSERTGPAQTGSVDVRRLSCQKHACWIEVSYPLGAIQSLLGHSKIVNTVRYLGVDVEDALELAEATEV
ncbi:hypothetical protein FJ944_21870 [Mesorhizobium sp. B2-4-11]|nr:hypothetical protein FJ944_21870 [Mesorhizobium sp. B2-4-11]